MRPRQKDRHLPRCVFRNHNAYYLVRKGKWIPLGRDLPAATAEYARRIAQPTMSWPANPRHEKLLDAVSDDKAPMLWSGSAVYFLYKGDEIVYVGQAINLWRRVAEHVSTKDFDHVSWIKCPAEELNELERRAILRFQPKLNVL